jgi:anthranilate phosphoribosyltransferase
VLDNQHGAASDIVILNAGVALYACQRGGTMKAGIERAREAIESGAAKAKLEQLVVTAHALSNRPDMWRDPKAPGSPSASRCCSWWRRW